MSATGAAFKLDPQKVAEIRAIGDSLSKEEIGRQFGITPSNVAKVLKRETWPDGGYAPRGFLPGDPRNPSTRRRGIEQAPKQEG
jgi:hypothetical protein